ncbi:YciI family protein [Streptacidiphilus sp. PAMC 29251]
MKFMLMIYANQETWDGLSAEEMGQGIAEQDAFNTTFFETGELISAYGLADAATARTVRVRAGAAAVTDGPYLETKEYLASFCLLDCQDETRALEIAARMPFAAFNAVEVWPVMHEAVPQL